MTFDPAELAAMQSAAWSDALRRQGLTDLEVDDARALAERIMSALHGIPDDVIESGYGFGDYDRGIATLAAVEAIKARRPSSYITVTGAGPAPYAATTARAWADHEEGE
jgi:hypothetical protein